jgi:hypothetical protein
MEEGWGFWLCPCLHVCVDFSMPCVYLHEYV